MVDRAKTIPIVAVFFAAALLAYTINGSLTVNGTETGGTGFASSVFAASQFTTGNQGLVGGTTLAAEYQAAYGAGTFAVFGSGGATKTPNTATILNSWGIVGAASSASTTTNTVGGGFLVRATAAGSGTPTAQRVRLWGINPVMGDGNFANVEMQNEFDINVNHAGTLAFGLSIVGASTAALDAGSVGIILGAPGTGITWPVGIVCADASTATCFQAGVQSTGNNSFSEVISMISRDSGGATHTFNLVESPAGQGAFFTSATQGFSFNAHNSLSDTLQADGGISPVGVANASLGTPANGTIQYCTDCASNSNPCTASSTGAIAKRLNGAWDCR